MTVSLQSDIKPVDVKKLMKYDRSQRPSFRDDACAQRCRVSRGEHRSEMLMNILCKTLPGEDYFAGTSIKYQGLRVEDTPQTQICRYRY